MFSQQSKCNIKYNPTYLSSTIYKGLLLCQLEILYLSSQYNIIIPKLTSRSVYSYFNNKYSIREHYFYQIKIRVLRHTYPTLYTFRSYQPIGLEYLPSNTTNNTEESVSLTQETVYSPLFNYLQI